MVQVLSRVSIRDCRRSLYKNFENLSTAKTRWILEQEDQKSSSYRKNKQKSPNLFMLSVRLFFKETFDILPH